MCGRFTVLSDTPIPSAIAGCVIPISRHSTIWMRSRCARRNFQCRAVFSRRTSALLHLIICPPNQMVGSESCRARKKYCTNHTHPLSPQKSRFKRVWRRYEASRLARNGRDWHTLLEFCTLVNSLIIDEDGVYDPKLINDRLLLGMKGTVSELELSILSQR